MRLTTTAIIVWVSIVFSPPAIAEDLFRAGCADCHGRKGEGNDHLKVPAVAGLPDYYVVQQLQKFRQYLRGMKSENKRVKNMHAAAVTMDDAAMRSIAQSVAAMKPVAPVPTIPGDVNEGKQLYEQVCAECHGPSAEGNAAKESPPLYGFQDWYLEAQINSFRAGERRADPLNFDSVRMHKLARELRRKRDIRNLVRYIGDQLTGESDGAP